MGADVFIQRVITVDGQDVSCRFFRPEVGRGDFGCRFELDWPEGTETRVIYGVDEAQALLLAMRNAHGLLLIARERHGRTISWFGEHDLGLPIHDGVDDSDVDADTAPHSKES
jgi:hypothetical protein